MNDNAAAPNKVQSPSVSVQGLALSYGSVKVLHELDLDIGSKSNNKGRGRML